MQIIVYNKMQRNAYENAMQTLTHKRKPVMQTDRMQTGEWRAHA